VNRHNFELFWIQNWKAQNVEDEIETSSFYWEWGQKLYRKWWWCWDPINGKAGSSMYLYLNYHQYITYLMIPIVNKNSQWWKWKGRQETRIFKKAFGKTNDYKTSIFFGKGELNHKMTVNIRHKSDKVECALILWYHIYYVIRVRLKWRITQMGGQKKGGRKKGGQAKWTDW
jgi:hypothetical protein